MADYGEELGMKKVEEGMEIDLTSFKFVRNITKWTESWIKSDNTERRKKADPVVALPWDELWTLLSCFVRARSEYG